MAVTTQRLSLGQNARIHARMLTTSVGNGQGTPRLCGSGEVPVTDTQPHAERSGRVHSGQRLHVIVNPKSGNGRTQRTWPTIDRRLKRLGYEVDFRMTESGGDGARLGREAVEHGIDEVVVVGGDGTVNEVVNGLFTASHGESPDVTLSVLPAGTGRDFSRSIGIRSVEHALETLGDGEIRQLDVGRVDYTDETGVKSRYFVNAGDVGLGAETAALLNRSSKLLGGKISYFLGAARSIITYQGRPAKIEADGEIIHDGLLAMTCFSNGRFHAGGMRMAPDASMTDGYFDLLVLRDVPKYALLGSLLPSVYLGRHISHSAVTHRLAQKIRITSPEALLFEVDGEQPGTTDISVTLLPGALRVRVPVAR
jgi:diacylglycerol kinase (ATP)